MATSTVTRPDRAVRRAGAGPTLLTRVALIVSAVVAVTAVPGGLELILWPQGNSYLDGALLDDLPVDSFVLPGLALLVLVGGTALVATMWLWRTRRAEPAAAGRAWWATLTAGLVLTGWIGLELLLLPGFSPLEAVYGLLGLVQVATAALTLRRSG